ncbi:MAG: glycosyltransferase [Armatimonadota bacterium]|nr:glycosyltransferase [Armatimonadota bacterium]
MIRVCFVTRVLTAGGSERQLVNVAAGLDPARFDVVVATFYAGGILQDELSGHPHVRVVTLGKRNRWDLAGFAARAIRLVRRLRPDVVCGYLPTANEVALLAGRLAGCGVVWRVGAAAMDLSPYDWAWRVGFGLGRWASRWPDRIIVNSWAGFEHCRTSGWWVRRMVVVPNGIDVERFRRDPVAGAALRAEWRVPVDSPLIGLVARLDPVKDHLTFLHAAARFGAGYPSSRFVCVGDGSPAYAAELRAEAERLGLGGRLVWAGARRDMTAVYNACDLITLCSRAESFPNALGEAMACERPCVASGVGDVPTLLGDTGTLVPVADADALASAWRALLARPVRERCAIGVRARDRIVKEFALDRTVDRIGGILSEVAARRKGERVAARRRST